MFPNWFSLAYSDALLVDSYRYTIPFLAEFSYVINWPDTPPIHFFYYHHYTSPGNYSSTVSIISTMFKANTTIKMQLRRTSLCRKHIVQNYYSRERTKCGSKHPLKTPRSQQHRSEGGGCYSEQTCGSKQQAHERGFCPGQGWSIRVWGVGGAKG